MTREEHYIQDSSELYAVALLQQLAEDNNRAPSIDSGSRWYDFESYLEHRGISYEQFESGRYAEYKQNVDTHIPTFFFRLMDHYPAELFTFTNVEAAYRNQNLKGDFTVDLHASQSQHSVSLKNYRKNAGRPQLCSGTFNSFVLNFIFENSGVGQLVDPITGRTFRGSSKNARNGALRAVDLGELVPIMEELDEINQSIRDRFVYGEEFEFLDEKKFDKARKETGLAGVDATCRALAIVGERRIRKRVLQMIGLDGVEDALFFDSTHYTDSITVPAFHDLLAALQATDSVLEWSSKGQSIQFEFRRDDTTVLHFYVPFTINKNGAWISGQRFEGTRYHKKEGRELAWRQRRPKKSKELATSVNTWVNFEAAGVFI